ETGDADVLGAKAAERIAGNRPAFDQVAHLAMKICEADGHALAEKILLHPAIQLPAFLRLEVGIAEGRTAETGGEKQLVQSRRLESLGVTRLQPGAGCAEMIGGGERRRPG